MQHLGLLVEKMEHQVTVAALGKLSDEPDGRVLSWSQDRTCASGTWRPAPPSCSFGHEGVRGEFQIESAADSPDSQKVEATSISDASPFHPHGPQPTPHAAIGV